MALREIQFPSSHGGDLAGLALCGITAQIDGINTELPVLIVTGDQAAATRAPRSSSWRCPHRDCDLR